MDYQYNNPLKKCIYIKPHVMDSIKSGQSKVLINPTFMKPPVVHFNPHFKPNFTVHVNPNVLKSSVESNAVKSLSSTSNEKVSPRPIIHIAPNKVVRVSTKEQVKNNYKKVNIISMRKHPFKVDNRTTAKTAVCQKPMARISIKEQVKSKYRKVNNILMQKHPFRIDNRTTTKAVASKKISKRVTNPSIKNVYVKCNKKPVSTVNGNRKLLINSKVNVSKVSLMSSGKRYKIGVNNRTLALRSNKSGKSTNKMTAVHLRSAYFKNNMGKHLLSQSRSKNATLLKNKLKKSNMPCPFYHKFGRCKGKENGTCIRIHNADQVSLCPKFLQGSCLNKSCLLSHKVSAEKMPTCRFYLDGLCSKDDCPYLHVKINAKAEICRDFLEGFCKNGAECEKRHQYLCPDFEQKGSCRQRKCQYPHKNVVRDKVLRSLPSKLQTRFNKIPKPKPCSSTNQKEAPEKLLTVRYYVESLPEQVQVEERTKMDDSDVANANSRETNSEKHLVRKRPTVGDLPSFIPFL